MVRGDIGLFTAYAFVPMRVFIDGPIGGEFVVGGTLLHGLDVGIDFVKIGNRSGIGDSYEIGASAVFGGHHDFGIQFKGVRVIVFADEGYLRGAVIVSPIPCRGSICVTESGDRLADIAVFAVVTFVDRIAARRAGRIYNDIRINVSKSCREFGLFFTAICTFVLDITVGSTGCFHSLNLCPCVTDRIDLLRIAVAAIRTGINGASVFRAGCFRDFSHVIVTVAGDQIFDLSVMATNADGKIIFVLQAVAVDVLGGVGMTVQRATFRGSQSRYGIVGEVVRLEGDVTVMIGCFDGFQFTVIVDEPDRNAIHVLAILQGVRKRDGYPVIFTESGNIFRTVIHGKVIDRVVANLLELFGGQTEIGSVIALQLISGNRDLLVADRVDNAVVKADVGIIQFNFGILQIVRVGGAGIGTFINGNVLGRAAMRTFVGSDTVLRLTLDPIVARRVLRDRFGLGIAASAGQGLDTVVLTGCGRGNACNVVVLIYGLADHLISATLTDIHENIFAIAELSFFGSYADGIVSERVALFFRIDIAAITYVGLRCSGTAGCLGFGDHGINVRGYVRSTANVTVVIFVSVGIGAIFKNGTATVVADVVVIRCGIRMVAHIVLAAVIVTNVIGIFVLMAESLTRGRTAFGAGCGNLAGCFAVSMLGNVRFVANVAIVVVVFVLMTESLTRGRTAFGAGCGDFAGCFAVGVRGYVCLTANVAGMVTVAFRVGAGFKNRTATVVADVIVIRCGIRMVAHIVLAAVIVANVIGIFVLVTESVTGGRATFGTGRGRFAERLAVGVRGYVCLTANVAGMVTVAFRVGAGFKNRTATVVADVIVIRCGIRMVAHIVLAATAVTDMVLIVILMLESGAVREDVLLVRADRTAGAGLVIYCRTRAGCRRFQGLVLNEFNGIGVSQSFALRCGTGLTRFGSGAGCVRPIVSLRLNGCGFLFAAFRAFAFLRACFRTVCFLNGGPIAPCMITGLFAASRQAENANNCREQAENSYPQFALHFHNSSSVSFDL